MMEKHKHKYLIKLGLVFSLMMSSSFIMHGALSVQAEERSMLLDDEEMPVNIVLEQSQFNLIVGESATLVINEEESNYDPLLIQYELVPSGFISHDPKTGTITALKVGKATINIISLENNNEILASASVDVRALEGTISFKDPVSQLKREQEYQMELTVSDSLASLPVSWSSSDSSILEVDKNGLVTAKGLGTASITAQVDSYTVTHEITVISILEKISFNGSGVELEIRQNVDIPSLIYVPYDTTSNKVATYSTSNKDIFIIENGQIRGVGVGEAQLIATVGDLTTSIPVIVSPIKNADGAEVLTLGQHTVVEDAIVYTVDYLDLFKGDKIALEFDEESLLATLKEERLTRVRILLDERLTERNFKNVSSFAFSKEMFGESFELLDIQLEDLKENLLIAYRFEEVMPNGVNLLYSVKEITPENALYQKIQTKSYQLSFDQPFFNGTYQVFLPGEQISTSPGQMHFLYELEGEKLNKTHLQSISDTDNIIELSISNNENVITFNKIAILSNKGLILSLASVVVAMAAFGITKGIKNIRSRKLVV